MSSEVSKIANYYKSHQNNKLVKTKKLCGLNIKPFPQNIVYHCILGHYLHKYAYPKQIAVK